jgi:hypothetical protein
MNIVGADGAYFKEITRSLGPRAISICSICWSTRKNPESCPHTNSLHCKVCIVYKLPSCRARKPLLSNTETFTQTFSSRVGASYFRKYNIRSCCPPKFESSLGSGTHFLTDHWSPQKYLYHSKFPITVDLWCNNSWASLSHITISVSNTKHKSHKLNIFNLNNKLYLP